jgi:hypothetical protein
MKKFSLVAATLALLIWNASAQTNPFPTELDIYSTVSTNLTTNCSNSNGNNPNLFPVCVVMVQTTGDQFAILLDGSVLSTTWYAMVAEAVKTRKSLRFFSCANPKYYYANLGSFGLGPYRELTALWDN